MKKGRRRALVCVAAAGILGLSALLSGCAYMDIPLGCLIVWLSTFYNRTTDRTELSEYDQYLEWVKSASEYMPALEDLSDYEEIQVFQRTREESIFVADTVTLVVTYNAENYGQKKEEVIASYEFLAEPVGEEMPQAEFMYNGYDICVIAEEYNQDPYSYYPKCFGMIGVNDEEYKIAYMAFYDFDLDYIGEDMNWMMDNYFRLE